MPDIACATGLTVEHMPLPWYDSLQLALPLLYRVSIWVALVLGAAFIGIYAARVAEEARRLGDALTATELVLAREQHLTQLDGLAAAAAHELGTPLATIALVAAELRKQLAARCGRSRTIWGCSRRRSPAAGTILGQAHLALRGAGRRFRPHEARPT